MPIGRYFLIMGGVLLALLFLVSWSLPTLTAAPEEASNEHPTILIHSRHRWPDAVVFDTSRPTIVPATVAAAAPPEKPVQDAKAPMDAMAMAEPAAPVEKAAPTPASPKRLAERRRPRAHREARRDDARRVASYDMFGYRQPFIFGGW